MKSLIPLRYRRVLWGTAMMAACLFSGFTLMMSKIPVHAPRGEPGREATTASAAGSADLALSSAAVRDASGTPAATQPRLVEAYGRLPLSFEINQGQTDSRVKFVSRGSGYSLFLTGNEAVLALRKPVQKANGKRQLANRVAQRSLFNAAALPGVLLPAPAQLKDSFASRDEARIPLPESQAPAVLRMRLVGANPQAKVSGLEQLPGKSNYFIGSDPRKWRTNVPNYAKVKYANVYPGVDLVYYGSQGQLEYDFVLQPGADPRSIQLAIDLDGQVGSRQKAVGSESESQLAIANGQS